MTKTRKMCEADPGIGPWVQAETAFTAAAGAYVKARESGRPIGSRYRAMRRAWVAMIRAERLMRNPT